MQQYRSAVKKLRRPSGRRSFCVPVQCSARSGIFKISLVCKLPSIIERKRIDVAAGVLGN